MRVMPSNSSPVAARKALRAELRARRRAVTPEFRAKAARQVARNVDRVFRLRPGMIPHR
jgi:hypothetical protein